MDEDKLHASISRGAHAKALVEDALLSEAFDKLEAEYITAWKTWPAVDTDGRERLWVAVNVLGKVRDHLVRIVANGKLAAHELKDLVRRVG